MKNLKHGTVVGEMEPQVRELFAKHARRKKRQTGYVWYLRLKLYDEAFGRGKAVDALTDEEFEDALYSIDRYFKMNPAQPTQWGLQPMRAPQSANRNLVICLTLVSLYSYIDSKQLTVLVAVHDY